MDIKSQDNIFLFFYSINISFRRSLPLDELKLGPEEGIVIAFVPNFDRKGDEAKEIVNAETAQE